MSAPAPDSLTTVADVKTVLTIGDTTEDSALALLVPMVSALITESLGRTFLLAGNAANPITEYLSGQGFERLLLRHRPVQGPRLSGNTTAGSTTVSGLASTSYLFAGGSVAGPALQPGTSVAAVGSGQLTLSQAAALTASATPLVFGPGVWLDDAAFWGTTPGCFAAATQLFEGQDFALRRDEPAGDASRSGILERINGTWSGQYRRDVGLLSSYLAAGQGNIKVTYVAGWAAIPADLELAAIRVIAKVRNSKWYGELVAGEGYEGQNYSLQQHQGEVRLGLLDGDVAPLLARYRNYGGGL